MLEISYFEKLYNILLDFECSNELIKHLTINFLEHSSCYNSIIELGQRILSEKCGLNKEWVEKTFPYT
ncbi:MAG TPA: hypothetical protein VMZ91_12010 [Candidatus Paceibacterota bacterium]|nr:hypothetical protein [Candidatus Paceibacterota bacterium]